MTGDFFYINDKRIGIERREWFTLIRPFFVGGNEVIELLAVVTTWTDAINQEMDLQLLQDGKVVA